MEEVTIQNNGLTTKTSGNKANTRWLSILHKFQEHTVANYLFDNQKGKEMRDKEASGTVQYRQKCLDATVRQNVRNRNERRF